MSHQKIAQFWTKVAGTLLDKEAGSEQRDTALFATAEYVRKNPHRIKKQRLPKRAKLIDDDDKLLDAMEDPKVRDKHMLNFFYSWRDHVVKLEAINASNILLALCAMRTFHRLEIPEATEEVRANLFDEFGWDDDVPVTLKEVRDQSSLWSLDLELLSQELRLGHRIRKESEEPDPEDDFSFIPEGGF